MPYRNGVPLSKADLAGMRVVVMGLGLNGGGLGSARFLARAGAEVTVTDGKDAEALAPSIRQLDGLPIRYVLGRHELADFQSADLVVKNPGVCPDSPFLAAARRVETDLSIFLALSRADLVAVTGSKGKSTTSSAIAWALREALPDRDVLFGGNITVSVLDLVDRALEGAICVLELSSFQLGDLKGRGLLKPRVSVLTRIVPDHLDRYGTMEAYLADKRAVYEEQENDAYTVCDADDAYGRDFAAETRARVRWYADRLGEGAWGAELAGGGMVLRPDASPERVLPDRLLVPGAHNRRNLLAAGLAATLAGAEPVRVAEALGRFPGVPHRLEVFAEKDGVAWCNDSAATVPESVEAALAAFDRPVVLVTGGTDKGLDFAAIRASYARAKGVVLLAGTGSEKIRSLLDADGIAYHGPFGELDEAVLRAASLAEPGDVVALSPGCTSFGMFRNEFDRGDRFREAVRRLVLAG